MGGCVSTPVARSDRNAEPERGAARTPTASHSAASTPPDRESNPFVPVSPQRSAAFEVSIVPQSDSITSEHPFTPPPRTTPEAASASIGTPSRWSVTRTGGAFGSSRSLESSPLGSPAPDGGFLSPHSVSRQHTPRAQPGLAPPPLPSWSNPLESVAFYGDDILPHDSSDPTVCPTSLTDEAPLGKGSPRPLQVLPATTGSGYLSSPSSKHVPSLARSSTESSLKGRSLEALPVGAPAQGGQQPEVPWVEYDALDEVRCPSVGGRSVPEQPADFWQRYLQQHGASGWEERCRREAQREEFRAMNDQLIRAQLAALAARGASVAPSPLHGVPDPGSPLASGLGQSSDAEGAVSRWIDETFSNS